MIDEVRCFMDLGWADASGGDAPSIQGGALYTPGLDLPVDLALRGAVYKLFTDGFAPWGGNLMLTGSVEVYYIGWFLYGGVGVNGMVYDEEKPWGGQDSKTEFDPAGALGALCAMNEKLSFFVEVSHVDQVAVSTGFRYQF